MLRFTISTAAGAFCELEAPEDSTIYDLKDLIAASQGIPPLCQILLNDNEILADDDKLDALTVAPVHPTSLDLAEDAEANDANPVVPLTLVLSFKAACSILKSSLSPADVILALDALCEMCDRCKGSETVTSAVIACMARASGEFAEIPFQQLEGRAKIFVGHFALEILRVALGLLSHIVEAGDERAIMAVSSAIQPTLTACTCALQIPQSRNIGYGDLQEAAQAMAEALLQIAGEEQAILLLSLHLESFGQHLEEAAFELFSQIASHVEEGALATEMIEHLGHEDAFVRRLAARVCLLDDRDKRHILASLMKCRDWSVRAIAISAILCEMGTRIIEAVKLSLECPTRASRALTKLLGGYDGAADGLASELDEDNNFARWHAVKALLLLAPLRGSLVFFLALPAGLLALSVGLYFNLN